MWPRVLWQWLTQSRGLHVHQVCKLCNSNLETIGHVLFCCPIAKALLDIAHIPAPSTGFSDSLKENLGYVLVLMGQQRVREESRNAIPWLLWSIWKNKNAILYSRVQEALEIIVSRSLEEVTHWRLLNKGMNNMAVKSVEKFSVRERWQRPLVGIVKCNIKSHWRNDMLHCGAAWIARDHSGAVLLHAWDVFTEIESRVSYDVSYGL